MGWVSHAAYATLAATGLDRTGRTASLSLLSPLDLTPRSRSTGAEAEHRGDDEQVAASNMGSGTGRRQREDDGIVPAQER